MRALRLPLAAAAIWALAISGVARADEATDKKIQELQKQLADMKAQLDEMQQNKASKDEMVKLLDKMQADASRRTAAMPAWAENLKFSGDFRLRYVNDSYNWGDSATSGERKDRNRARFRLRFGFVKTWMDDQLEVGFRLANSEFNSSYPGNNDPTSTNSTFGNDWSKKPIWIDLAYAKYAPKWAPGFSITGGKMKNPMLLNDVFLDDSVNPEGFWAEYKPRFGNFEPFVGSGYFILNEVSQSTAATSTAPYVPAHDSTMWAVQGGVGYNFSPDFKYAIGVLYQDYEAYNLAFGPAGAGNKSYTRGNDVLTKIPGFRIVDITNRFDFKVLNVPWTTFFDWAYNLDNSDVAGAYNNQSNAVVAGVNIGQNKKKGDWSLRYRYAYLQGNSIPGYFAWSDFGNSDRKGHVFGGGYSLTDDLTALVTVFITEPIHSTTTTTSGSATEDITTTLQADLVWRF